MDFVIQNSYVKYPYFESQEPIQRKKSELRTVIKRAKITSSGCNENAFVFNKICMRRICLANELKILTPKCAVNFQYEMVCADSYKKEMVRVAYMLGVFLAGPISGHISDRFGRRPTLLLFALMQFIFLNVVFLIFGLGYIPMLIGNFIIGIIDFGAYLPAFVLCTFSLHSADTTWGIRVWTNNIPAENPTTGTVFL
jgi:hypothetical protein